MGPLASYDLSGHILCDDRHLVLLYDLWNWWVYYQETLTKLVRSLVYLPIINPLWSLTRPNNKFQVMKSNNASGIATIERFLTMLEMVVQEPDTSFKSLLPSVMSFGLDHMIPTLSEDAAPDLRLSTLELFHQLLFHNWRWAELKNSSKFLRTALLRVLWAYRRKTWPTMAYFDAIWCT